MGKTTNTVLSIIGAAIAGYAIYRIFTKQGNDMATDKTLPRGYRNNNPLNIRISSSQWKGEIANNTDGSFEQFASMGYGFRAAFVLIRNYIGVYNAKTVAQIISRWAPNNENNTQRYIERVCRTTGFSPDMVIDPYDYEQMGALVYAMAIVENGYAPSWTDIQTGWALL